MDWINVKIEQFCYNWIFCPSLHGSHRNPHVDEPNHPIPRTRDMPARGGEKHPTTMRPIHHDRSEPVSKRILDTAPKIPHQGTISICIAGDSRWSVRQPL